MTRFCTVVSAPNTRPRAASGVSVWKTVSMPANRAAPGRPTTAMMTTAGHTCRLARG